MGSQFLHLADKRLIPFLECGNICRSVDIGRTDIKEYPLWSHIVGASFQNNGYLFRHIGNAQSGPSPARPPVLHAAAAQQFVPFATTDHLVAYKQNIVSPHRSKTEGTGAHTVGAADSPGLIHTVFGISAVGPYMLCNGLTPDMIPRSTEM